MSSSSSASFHPQMFGAPGHRTNVLPVLTLLRQQGPTPPQTSTLCIFRHTALPPKVCTLHPAMFERPGLLALYSGAAAPSSNEASGNYWSDLIEPQRPWMTPHRRRGQSDSFNTKLVLRLSPRSCVTFFNPRGSNAWGLKRVTFFSFLLSYVRLAKPIFHLIFVLLFFISLNNWGSLGLAVHFLGYSPWI